MRPLPRAMPALITPFTRSERLDLRAHTHNVARMWDLGMQGILVAGSTGEGPYLEPGERCSLVAAARRAAPRAFVLCGIHAETVRAATDAMAEADAGGADAVLLATPTTLVRHRPDLIELFFAHLVERAPLPVLLYSVPSVTGLELDAESVLALAAHQAVVGMKDSGGDPVRAERLVAETGDGFSLYAGATAAVSLSIAAGAHGAITASANYAPRLLRATVTAARRSAKSAAPLQSTLGTAAAAIERHGIAAVKYAARRVGFAPGASRRPLLPVSPQVQRAVRKALKTAGLA